MKAIQRAPETEHRKRTRWHWKRTPRTERAAGAPGAVAPGDRTGPAPGALGPEEIEKAVFDHRLRVGFLLMGIVLAMSLAFSAWIVGAHGYFLGVLMIFMFLTFSGWPFWAATIQSEGENTRNRLRGTDGDR